MYSISNQSYQVLADARYAKAKRHSRRIRLLRVAVPVLVAVALLGIAGVSIFNPFRILSKLPIDVGRLGVSGTKITMDAPHLAGFTPDQRPYELWAKSAVQDVTTPNNVELHQLRAKVQMEDQSQVTMDGRIGQFDTKSQLLNLQDDILLVSSTGYEARLTQAVVDIAHGNVSSDQPVAVKLLNGTLDAQRLRITENGALVRFEGGVSMILLPDDPSRTPDNNSDKPAGRDAPKTPVKGSSAQPSARNASAR